MEEESKTFYGKFTNLTQRWWFYALYFSVPLIVPPITAKGLSYWSELSEFTWYVSAEMYAHKLVYSEYMGLLHILVVGSILLLVLLRDKFARIFSIFVSLNILVMMFIQTFTITERYGLVIITELFFWYILVALVWFWEILIHKTKITFSNFKPRLLWLIPLALFAFWDPEKLWDFKLMYFYDSYSPTALCMMTPIYLVVLIYQIPNINIPLFRVMSFNGLIMSLLTIGVAFFKEFTDALYWLLLHVPLMAVSLYAIIISFSIKHQEVPSYTDVNNKEEIELCQKLA